MENLKSQYIKIVEGNLLDSKEQYIGHQCNCVTSHAKTLAEQIFKKYPYADTYKKGFKIQKTPIINQGQLMFLAMDYKTDL